MGFSKKIRSDAGIIGIWEFTESSEQMKKKFSFSETEKLEFEKLKIEKRRREYLATRLLLEKILGNKIELIYNANGKPQLKNDSHNISISHSSELVTIILSEKKSGIDTENTFRDTEKIAAKFLSPAEQSTISQSLNPALNRIVYWSAKEAIYKCASHQGIQFDRQILIYPFEIQNNGQLNARLDIHNKSLFFNLWYFFFGNNVVVYCVER